MLDANKPSHFPFFSELNARGRSRLLGATRHVRLPPYAKVIERGDEVAGVYLVEAGALRIYYVSSEGREGTLYWVDPGQSCIIALNCLFARLPYPAWVETDQADTDVAIISGDVYRELYLAEPALQHFTFATLSTRLFELMTLLLRIVWSRTTCCGVSSETLGKRSKRHMSRSRTIWDLLAKWSQGFSATWQEAVRSDFRRDPSRLWTPTSSAVPSNRLDTASSERSATRASTTIILHRGY